MSANLLLHSLSNFREVILPALELAGARRIVEIGSEYGTFTQDLFAYASRVDGHFTSIDPAPQPVALEFITANRGNPHFQFIQATSVEALPKLEVADAYIIDGDHNYFTVRTELELIAKACAGKPVLIFEHDVGWPCGRRDTYYTPAAIPENFRQPYSMQAGMTLDNPGTVEGGFRGEGIFGCALHEGGAANGVQTAIEDVIAEHPELRFEIIHAIFGLGIVYPINASWAENISAHLRPYTQNSLLAKLERNRLELYLKVIELQDRQAETRSPRPEPPPAQVSAPQIFNQMPDVASSQTKTSNGTTLFGKGPSAGRKSMPPARNGVEAEAEAELSSFVELVTGLVITGLEQQHDVPELWRTFGQFSKDECGATLEFVIQHSLTKRPQINSHEHTTFLILTALLGHHAGRKSLAELRDVAESLFLANSQSPLITGLHFHVRQLGDPNNPLYRLENHVCQVPFMQLDVLRNSSHLCCASWLHKSSGNLAEQDYREVWNSAAADEIRQSVLDGSFRFCNKTACPHIFGGTLPRKDDLMNDPWWADVITNKKGIIDRFPQRINLAYDRQCNLACPSCRTSVVTTSEAEQITLDDMTKRNLYPLLTTAKEVYVTGSGDPFASKTFRKMLQWISRETCPDLKVRLMTNGMLFTEAEWARFPNLNGKIGLVKVSMDGASKATHELLRRGSCWETMMQNLPFIGRLLKKGEISAFELVFIVQQENYREMGDFVDLAARVGANRVYFERITNWGTFTPGQYQAKAVFNDSHPEHQAFLEVMKDARLRRPEVIINSFTAFLPPGPLIPSVPTEGGLPETNKAMLAL